MCSVLTELTFWKMLELRRSYHMKFFSWIGLIGHLFMRGHRDQLCFWSITSDTPRGSDPLRIIVFVTKQVTARNLTKVVRASGLDFLRPEAVVGHGNGKDHGMSVREQNDVVAKFRDGQVCTDGSGANWWQEFCWQSRLAHLWPTQNQQHQRFAIWVLRMRLLVMFVCRLPPWIGLRFCSWSIKLNDFQNMRDLGDRLISGMFTTSEIRNTMTGTTGW